MSGEKASARGVLEAKTIMPNYSAIANVNVRHEMHFVYYFQLHHPSIRSGRKPDMDWLPIHFFYIPTGRCAYYVRGGGGKMDN